jgi:hypothetical protein
MVHLLTVSSSFQAQVIAARLGSEGIVTELRGSVGGPYPIGDVAVYVADDGLESARELLLADEVESSFQPPSDEPVAPWGAWVPWVAALLLFVLLGAAMLSRAAG